MTYFIELICEKLAKHNYHIDKFLGSGTKGEAFALTNGNALKITKDLSEAKAMNLIKVKEFKNIVKVFNVWKFKDMEDLYFIEQEKLKNIPNDIFRDMMKIYVLPGKIRDNNYKARTFSLFELLSFYFNDPDNFYDIKEQHENILTLMKKAARKKDAELEKFITDMYAAKEELKSANIIYHDFGENNVMVDNYGTYKLIDLGYSQSTGVVDDIRENKLLTIINKK